MKVITKIYIYFFILFLSTSIAKSQVLNYDVISGVQMKYGVNSSYQLIKDDISFGYTDQYAELNIPIKHYKMPHFDKQKLKGLGVLNKFVHTSPYQSQLNLKYTSQSAYYQEQKSHFSILEASLKGVQYMPIHTFFNYNIQYSKYITGISEGNYSEDFKSSTLNSPGIFVANLGFTKVKNSEHMFYFGTTIAVLSKYKKMILPVVGVKIRNGNDFEMKLILPYEFMLTVKPSQRFAMDFRTYLNNNLSSFKNRTRGYEYAEWVQKTAIRVGLRARYQLSPNFTLRAEGGMERFNKLLYISPESFEKNNLPTRLYSHISITYHLKKSDGVHQLLEFK